MKRNTFLLFFTLLFSTVCLAGEKDLNTGGGHKIRVKIDHYEQKDLVLGFHYGDKQYVKDTAQAGPDGYFSFEADTLLPCGIYLFVMKPDNNFIQFVLTDADQDFSITVDAKDVVNTFKVNGSNENSVFYEYLQYLGKMRVDADTLKAQQSRTKNPKDSLALATKLTDIDKLVKKYQANLIEKHQGSLAAKIVRASVEPEPPEFKGAEKDVQRKKYYWFRDHYFDNVDIADPCLLRSPVVHTKIDYFVTKYTPQHPDTINKALDQVIGKIKNSPEVYKFYLIHFLNFYAKSTIVGMDACYVHVAKNYYCNGYAPWAKKEDLEKICDNANRLEPILIGKTAPNIVVKDRNNQPHALWDVDADFTVLFFWDPECGHCKKAAPHMVEFAEKFKNRGVKIFSVCTATGDKGPDCWKSIEEKGFSDFLFLNYYDPFIQSRYKTLYDVRTTPQLFILDRKHEILVKRIGAEQLIQVMEDLIKFQAEKKKNTQN